MRRIVDAWTVPRVFEGRTVAVIASGESLTPEQVQAVRAADVPAIVINSTFRMMPDAWALYAADEGWWQHPDNADAMAFAGLRISVAYVNGVKHLENTGTHGFDMDPSCIRTGGNSGFQGLHVAAHTGASRILLLGFDMRGEGHWHGDHPAPLEKTPPGAWPRWIERFDGLAEALWVRNIRVLNCSPNSALKCFPMMSVEDALEACAVSSA